MLRTLWTWLLLWPLTTVLAAHEGYDALLMESSLDDFHMGGNESYVESFQLQYFGVRGRAELSRLILEYAEASWEEVQPQAWPKDKPNTPFGQVMQLAQSHAIERYLARKFGLLPEDPMEAAKVDSVFEAYNDLAELWKKVERAGEDTKAKVSSAFFSESFPNFSRFHEPLLHQNGRNGLYAGSKVNVLFLAFLLKHITLADLQAFLILHRIFEVGGDNVYKNMEGYKRTPGLFLLVENVSSHPRIRQYLDSEKRHKK
ncbi:hypothetical protein BC829DRAFT_416842 [Chytridium lagenaria]|nr:hypothetical protein BC829DRAFT_416842 [Chytridium lagenaria]